MAVVGSQFKTTAWDVMYTIVSGNVPVFGITAQYPKKWEGKYPMMIINSPDIDLNPVTFGYGKRAEINYEFTVIGKVMGGSNAGVGIGVEYVVDRLLDVLSGCQTWNSSGTRVNNLDNPRISIGNTDSTIGDDKFLGQKVSATYDAWSV